MYLNRPDNNLPGVETLLDPIVFADRIRPLIGHCELKILNVRYKPDTSCLVSYELRQDGTTDYLHAKSFRNDDWIIRKKKLVDKALLDDELSLAVFKFPQDTKLGSIARLKTDPSGFLSNVLFDEFDDLPFEKFDILAYKPNRRLVAKINMSNDLRLVLKLHDKSTFKAALRSVRALKKLPHWSRPERVGRSTNHRALAYRWIDGETLNLEKLNASDQRSTMESIFDWLGELKQSADIREIKLRVSRPVDGLSGIANYIDSICPSLAKLSRQVSRELFECQPDKFLPSLAHGDFYDKQILVSANDIRVCDFDNCCIGDTTLDLANFVAQLKYRQSVHQTSIDLDAVKAQCDEHFSHPGTSTDLQRFNWNVAACLFRLVAHPFRSGCENWISKTEAMLNLVSDLVPENSMTSVASQLSDELSTAICEDSKFDFLVSAFDCSAAKKTIGKRLSKFSKTNGEFAINKIQAVRHKRGRRCLIEYQLATDSGFQTVLGKASAKRLDRKAYRIQRRLFKNHDFDYFSQDGICVPKTLGKCYPWQMWFQEKVDALSGAELMQLSRLSTVTQRIAAAVAKLHGSGFIPDRDHSIDDELAILEKRLNELKPLLTNHSDAIQSILDDCKAIGTTVDSDLRVPIHRDFYQDQILFSEDRTYLVDLDLVAFGHPAIDIGNFCAHLAEDGIRNHDDPRFWQTEEREIIDGYLQLNPLCNEHDVLALKAISFSRHIFISRQMPERRRINSKIIEFALQLNDEVLNARMIEQT